MSPDSSAQPGFRDDEGKSGGSAGGGGAASDPGADAAKRRQDAEDAWRNARDGNAVRGDNGEQTGSTSEGGRGRVAEVPKVPIPKPQVVEAQAVSSEPIEENLEGHVDPHHFDEFMTERGEFWDILEQAGISKRKFFIFLFTGILVILSILFFLFGKFDFSGIGGGGDVVEEGVERVVEAEPKADEDFDVGELIDASFIVGLEYSKAPIIKNPLPLGFLGEDFGIEGAFFVGKYYDADQSNLIYYISFLSRLKSIYETDIYALLDQSIGRREALDAFLAEMAALIVEGERIAAALDSQLDFYNDQYRLYNDDKIRYENVFFDAVDSLSGEAAEDNLKLFTESGQEALRVKSLYNAYASVLDMYLNSLAVIKPRYADIDINRDALVRGVRVFDVPQSDIEAIIDVPPVN